MNTEAVYEKIADKSRDGFDTAMKIDYERASDKKTGELGSPVVSNRTGIEISVRRLVPRVMS